MKEQTACGIARFPPRRAASMSSRPCHTLSEFNTDRLTVPVTTMDGWHHDLIAGLGAANTMEAIFAKFADAAESLGFEYCCYGIRIPLSIKHRRILIFDNYPSGWTARYREQNYCAIDPTVALAGAYLHTALVWSDQLFAAAPALWHEAQSYGLKFGWSQSARDQSGITGFLSLARAEVPLQQAEILAKSVRFAWLAQTGHAAVVKNCFAELVPGVSSQLTLREREVMLWTAEGKTALEIGSILNMSRRTVNFHVANVIKKLNCTNKLQAVVKAVVLGLMP